MPAPISPVRLYRSKYAAPSAEDIATPTPSGFGAPVRMYRSKYENGSPPVAPVAPRVKAPKPQESEVGMFGDAFGSFAQGGIGAIKSVTDIFGADNPVSESLGQDAEYWRNRVSPARAAELELQEREKAELGDVEGVGGTVSRAALFARQAIRNPVATLSEGFGNIVPLAVGGAAAGATKVAALGARAVATGIGAAMGVGAVKGGIYDTTLQSLLSQGVPEETAKAKASEAQSYAENPDLIAAGGVVGAASGMFGADPAIAGMTRAGVSAASREALEKQVRDAGIAGFGRGMLKEAVTEAPQESFETIAGNVGAILAGAAIDPTQGALEAGVKAGIMSAVPGGVGTVSSGMSSRRQLRDVPGAPAPGDVPDEDESDLESALSGTGFAPPPKEGFDPTVTAFILETEASGKDAQQALVGAGLSADEAKAAVANVRAQVGTKAKVKADAAAEQRATKTDARVDAEARKKEADRAAAVEQEYKARVAREKASRPSFEDAAAVFDQDPLAARPPRPATAEEASRFQEEAVSALEQASREAAAADAELPSRVQAQRNLEDQAYRPLIEAVTKTQSEAQKNLEDQWLRERADQVAVADAGGPAFYVPKLLAAAVEADSIKPLVDAGYPTSKYQLQKMLAAAKASRDLEAEPQQGGPGGGDGVATGFGDVPESVQDFEAERVVGPGSRSDQPGEVATEASRVTEGMDSVFGTEQGSPAGDAGTGVPTREAERMTLPTDGVVGRNLNQGEVLPGEAQDGAAGKSTLPQAASSSPRGASEASPGTQARDTASAQSSREEGTPERRNEPDPSPEPRRSEDESAGADASPPRGDVGSTFGQESDEGDDSGADSISASGDGNTVSARGRGFSVDRDGDAVILRGSKGAEYPLVAAEAPGLLKATNARRGMLGAEWGEIDALSGVRFSVKDGKITKVSETKRGVAEADNPVGTHADKGAFLHEALNNPEFGLEEWMDFTDANPTEFDDDGNEIQPGDGGGPPLGPKDVVGSRGDGVQGQSPIRPAAKRRGKKSLVAGTRADGNVSDGEPGVVDARTESRPLVADKAPKFGESQESAPAERVQEPSEAKPGDETAEGQDNISNQAVGKRVQGADSLPPKTKSGTQVLLPGSEGMMDTSGKVGKLKRGQEDVNRGPLFTQDEEAEKKADAAKQRNIGYDEAPVSTGVPAIKPDSFEVMPDGSGAPAVFSFGGLRFSFDYLGEMRSNALRAGNAFGNAARGMRDGAIEKMKASYRTLIDGLPDSWRKANHEMYPEGADAKKQTPLFERKGTTPFFSALERAAEQMKQPMMAHDATRFLLDPKRGAKVAEAKWTGLDDFLGVAMKDGKLSVVDPAKARRRVTPEEVQEFLKANAVTVTEADPRAPRFSQYQTPGGKNYREVLLTLPVKRTAGDLSENFDESRDPHFRSSHFDEPNILAHVRLNDREVDGKKVLFVEEIQSDWAQTGRRKGFATDRATESQIDDFKSKGWEAHETVRNPNRPTAEPGNAAFEIRKSGTGMKGPITATESEAWTALVNKDAIPSAPFVEKTEDWTALALKAILHKAASEGYDSVAWTTGSQQNERYQLSQQIEAVIANKTAKEDFWNVVIVSKGGERRLPTMFLKTSELADNVGKDLADKIVSDGGGEYRGLALDIGGEGMKAFYDKIVPQVAEKLAKKFGAKVGTVNLVQNAGKQRDDGAGGLVRDGSVTKQLPVHSIAITPEMRASVLEGQPLFSQQKGTMTEAQWKHYNGLTDAERARLYPEAYRKAKTVNGAPAGVRVADFEGDVSAGLVTEMTNAPTSSALAAKILGAVDLIRRHVPGLVFGGFTPAGNFHGVNIDAKVFVNFLATHQLALETAKEERITYAEAFARHMTDVLIHESAHYAVKGHGSEFKAEMARIKEALGVPALRNIRRDFMRYASEEKHRTKNNQLYEKALPGWREGERRGREAAADTGTEGRGGRDARESEWLLPGPRGDTRGDGDARGDDGRSGGVREAPGAEADDLAEPSFVRGSDGAGGVADFSRKPSAPDDGGPLLGDETKLQFLQRKAQDRLNRLSLGESAIKARAGDRTAPRLADRLYGTQPRIENILTHAEAMILKPLLDSIKADGLNFDLLGEAMKGDAAAKAKIVASGKAPKYAEAAKKIQHVYVVADNLRVIGGIDTSSSIAKLKAKRAKGKIESHPLYAALQDLERAVVQSEHNKAMKNLADFTEKAGPRFGTVTKWGEDSSEAGAIRVMRDGAPYALTLADEKMGEAVKALNNDQLDQFYQAVGAATRWVSKVNTILSPVFGVKNKVRDVGSAAISAWILEGSPKMSAKILTDAAGLMVGKSNSWNGTREFMANPAGKFAQGSPAWWAQQAHKNAAVPGYFRQIESIKKLESRLGEALKSRLEPKMSPKRFFEMMMDVAAASEASTRVAVYRALVESGISPDRAGDMARQNLDVNKTGEWSRKIGALSPFFNSSAQGAARLIQMMTSSDPAVKGRARAALGTLIAAGALVGMALAKWGADDDDDKIPDSDQHPEWDQQRSLIIGGAKIPLPQGFSAPFYAGFVASKALRGRLSPAQAGGYAAQAFWQQFSPIQSPFGVAQPIADVMKNEKFSGSRIYPTRYPGQTQPDSHMGFKSDTAAARAVAQGLNRVTGGDEDRSGLIDPSPGTIDYLTKSAFGALGKFMGDVYNASEAVATGKPVKRIPVVSDFIVDTERNQTGRFWDSASAIDDAYQTKNRKEKTVLQQELKALFPNENVEKATLTQLRKAMRDAVAEVGPERKAWFVSEMEELGGRTLKARPVFEEARDKLKALENVPDGPDKDARKLAIIQSANRAYAEAMRAK